MDPRNLKRIQIFALVMNMAATLNAWLQSVALPCVQHRIRQWKLASEIFGPNSGRQSSEGGRGENFSIEISDSRENSR